MVIYLVIDEECKFVSRYYAYSTIEAAYRKAKQLRSEFAKEMGVSEADVDELAAFYERSWTIEEITVEGGV